MTAGTRPMRAVTRAQLVAGRGSLLGPDTGRRVWWWDLTLDCGHIAQRLAAYQPRRDGRPPGAPRAKSDIKDAPTRARCEVCR